MRLPRRRKPRPSRAAGPYDPRIPSVPYDAAVSYGQRLGVLLDAIYDACPGGNASPEHLEKLSPAHRAVFVVEWAMIEIYNGTLDQYFFNSTGDMASDLPAAARFLGADDYATIFDDAVAYFDPPRITDRNYRQARLRELEETGRLDELGRVNDRIYELEDAGPVICEPVCEYIEAHRSVFFLDSPPG